MYLVKNSMGTFEAVVNINHKWLVMIGLYFFKGKVESRMKALFVKLQC